MWIYTAVCQTLDPRSNRYSVQMRLHKVSKQPQWFYKTFKECILHAQHLCVCVQNQPYLWDKHIENLCVRSVLFLSVLLLCFPSVLLCYFLSVIVSFLCLVLVLPCSLHVLSCVCLFMPCALLLLSMSPPLTCSQSSPCLFVWLVSPVSC